MAAIITSQIPPQPYEVIRDIIASILLLELSKQYELNNAIPQVKKVWVERYIPLDTGLDAPTVNVTLGMSRFMDKTQQKRNGVYTYYIDVYTTANTTANSAGDSAALMNMQRLMGIIDTILTTPDYKTLGLEPGIIGHTMVERFYVGDKSDVKDALSSVVGRMEFSVSAIQQNIITAVPVPLQIAGTKVKLGSSSRGYYIEYPAA